MPFQWIDKLFLKGKADNKISRLTPVNSILGKIRTTRVNPTIVPSPSISQCTNVPCRIPSISSSTLQHISADAQHNILTTTTGADGAAATVSVHVVSPSNSEPNSLKIFGGSTFHTSSGALNIPTHQEILTYIEHLDESTLSQWTTECDPDCNNNNNGSKAKDENNFISCSNSHQNLDLLTTESDSSNSDAEHDHFVDNVVDPLQSNFTPQTIISSIVPSGLEMPGSDDILMTDEQEHQWMEAVDDLNLLESESESESGFEPSQGEELAPRNGFSSTPQSQNLFDKRINIARRVVWSSVDTILENFGLTFLELVSNEMMLFTVTTYDGEPRKFSKSDNTTTVSSVASKNGTIPKIIVMIDDPPESHERKNGTMGRLLSVGLYLLGIQLFVIPSHDFASHALHSIVNNLLEDRQKYSSFKIAYNFILQTGFSQLLQRMDTQVIVFDGDWFNSDMCHLISLAETLGHHLIFMKNHPGIRKKAFVQVVITRIQRRLKEFGELRERRDARVSTPKCNSMPQAKEFPLINSSGRQRQPGVAVADTASSKRARTPRRTLRNSSPRECWRWQCIGDDDSGSKAESQSGISSHHNHNHHDNHVRHGPGQTVVDCDRDVAPIRVEVSESSAQVDEHDMKISESKFSAVRRTRSSAK